MSDYKTAKEAFVADNLGSSVHLINNISITALTAYAVYATSTRSLQPSAILDWLFVVFPLLLAVTVLAEHALVLNIGLAALAGLFAMRSSGRSAPAPVKPAGRWLEESDSEDDAGPATPRTPAHAAKPPSQVVAEAQARENNRNRQQLPALDIPSAGSSSALNSPGGLGSRSPSYRRSSPASGSSHAIDMASLGTDESVSPARSTPINGESFSRKGKDSLQLKARDGCVPHGMPSAPLPPRRHLAALSVYRAHMMVMTVLCILAVDFKVFPRVLGKCENFGTSLMDVGVGSFVFSLGIVSSRGFSPRLRGHSSGFFAWARALSTALRRAAPVLVLGIIRFIMVKGVEYPEHITEYGVHWNFFFTLGLVPALATALIPLNRFLPWGTMGLVLSAAHELVLSRTGLQDFVLGPLRPGILGMNKEGLASMPGYGAIFLLGLSAGARILRASSPTNSHRRVASEDVTRTGALNKGQEDRAAERAAKRRTELALELLGYAVAAWAGLGVCHALGLPVSRRLANMPYVIWTVAYNASYLTGYLMVDLWLVRDSARACPPLLEAINANGLPVFLAANLLTGIVNISMQSMYAGTLRSMAVLVAYSAAVCALAWAIRGRRIKI